MTPTVEKEILALLKSIEETLARIERLIDSGLERKTEE